MRGDATPEPSPFAGHGTDRSLYLPRLPREYYQGDAVVHWSLPISKRGKGWLNEHFHLRFRELMLHACAREGMICPVYCLMPDHIHLVWMGLRRNSDQRNGMKFFREHVGQTLRPHRFQHQPHDHVLREEERKRDAFSRVCFYVLANPVRAGLMNESEVWPHCGAVFPGYPALDLRDQGFWPLFWKLYTATRATDAGNIQRPPIT